jgi:protein SCO1/2
VKKYIQSYGINASNWVFLTGNEAETHRLGIENFMIYAGQEEQAVDGFAHSEAFTLVDKEGYVRGVYNVSQADQLEKLEKDIRKLITHEYTHN